MANIYGDSYGQISGLELQRDQARDNRYFQGLSANRAMAAMAQQQAQQQQANEMAFVNALMQQRRYADQQAQQQQLMEMDRQRQAEAVRQFNSEQALRRSQLQNQQGQQDYREASNALMQGLLRPDSIPTLYPTLTPQQQSRLGGFYNTLSQQESDQIKSGETLAQTVQAMLNAQRQAAGVAGLGKQPTPGRIFSNQGAIDAYNQNVEAMKANPPMLPPDKFQAFIASLTKNRIPIDRLSIDEENQRFSPAPVPRIFTGNQTPTTVPQPVVQTPQAQVKFQNELAAAQRAIQNGKDPLAVRALFKKNTGMEMP